MVRASPKGLEACRRMVQLEGKCGNWERPHAWCEGSRTLQEWGAAWRWPGREQGLKNGVVGTVGTGGGGMRRGSGKALETLSVCLQLMGGEDSGRVAGRGEARGDAGKPSLCRDEASLLWPRYLTSSSRKHGCRGPPQERARPGLWPPELTLQIKSVTL